jgi:hypothetical protein
MRSIFSQKRFILFLSFVALVLLLLLASALRDVDFQAGRALGRTESQTVQYSVEKTIREIVDVPLWKQALFWLLLFLLVLLVSSILSPELRKRIIRMFLVFAFSFWAIFYLLENKLLILPDLTMGGGLVPEGAAADEILPLPAFTPPDLPNWVIYLISLSVIVALLTLTWGLSRWWQRINSLSISPESLDDLAAIAQSSLDDLAAGGDWDDVIVACYARMSEVIGRKRGLNRNAAMTPAEFARRLEQAGLPGLPVQRLTRLFESVRYGAKASSQNEIDEAVSCLTAILYSCGEPI